MPHRVSGMDTPPDAPRASLDRPVSLTAQQLADWDEFERKFFQDYLERHRKEDEDAKLDYETRKARITVQLMQCQRERSAYEKKLKAVEGRIATLQDGLRGLNDEYKIHCLNVRVSRNRAHFDLQERFKKSREGGPLDTSLVDQLRRVGPPMMNFPIGNDLFDAGGGLDETADSVSTPTSDGTTEAGGEEVGGADESESTGVTVCRSDGTIVGTVTKLTEEPRLYKAAVDVLLRLPVRRNVVIREGRKFGQAELDNIYRSNDGRFSKWFSFMIQAVGVERPNLCDLCTKNIGPFPTCVRADGASPRCGNCEWSRRGCHDSQDKVSESQDLSEESDSEPIVAPIVPRQGRKSTAALAAGSAERSGPRRPLAPAPNRTETPGSGDASEGAEDQRDASPEKSPDPFDFDPEELMSPTITMRQENGVYTHPELMAGVPVEKIDPNHPYWEPNWRDPADLIRETLAGHEEKYNAHVQNPKDKPAHYKYFQGRQVNRGRSSLEFLENGPFHPFQVVGKRFMQPGITTYDTLHRLAGTLEELGRFKIKISATDWLRQRLCEIMDAEGDKFSLIKAVKDLYHDPKVQALRHLSGFGSVGRPVKGNSRAPKGSGKRKRKRKEPGSGEASPFSKRVKVAPPSLDADEAAPSPATEPARSGVPSPAGGPDTTDEDLEYDGCTDTDSVCGETVGDGDFRIREIRTRQHTTSQDMTQYWHLFPNIGLDLLLLQSADPPQWTQGPPADDFAAAMDDIDEVTYHPESLKVQVLLRSGGEIMAWFYRERTKRRLLALCRAEGREVRKAASSEYMEVEWTAVCDSDTQQVLTLADFE
ncbi:uncharacterized protein DNG_05773 [Cephalotrichum gorgonifer]|uniref:Uncharacterized protein n=1 Tax=Cephalotrichum gorgonifer TaxID=2041049 RepID=A0AAE8SVS7_9PEZI|nr:uncharacterized protein DNG_05773 [Cephalotrichum gorgonifer]